MPHFSGSNIGAMLTKEEGGMPCHNQQLNNVNSGQEHPMKQVRFANNNSSSSSSSSSVPAALSNSEPTDATKQTNIPDNLGPQLKLLPLNDQIRELQTIIRDKTTSRGDFVFCADRLIRLVVEEGLNQLPYSECTVTTPTGYKYEGVKFERGNCGVSIMRSGEAMEQGLRDCCRSIRIGKILIQSDEETQKAKVYYAKFPPDVYRRKVLLMYPILSTGNTVIEAVRVLIEHGVQPRHIILLSLFSTPHGAKSIIQEFPDITILTTEVHPVAPTHFGQRYFGTD
ncbi:uracil phosphoribosyltransferase homolog isoform X1 [Cebidichthys violaceus]|uniref:uracil phosphoribosyltransferase homolog isoform X1 n=2 Tax=Cebidichthys violaceus TaxID=271503 RepID=UPI0035CAC6C2